MSICLHRFVRWVIRLALASGAALGLLPPAIAQVGASPEASIYTNAQSWLNQNLPGQDKLPLRLEVTLGELDSRLRLAPCDEVLPYLPPGTQLWGKTRIGLRCVNGAVKWNVFLPVTIKAFGPAWVLKSQLAPGAVLAESDLMQVEADWAERSSPVVANQADWLGLVASRQLAAGQVLRQDMIKAPMAFASGAQVRVLAGGPGFEIVTSAQAVTAAAIGQGAKVRMDNGRVISGVVIDRQTVRVDL